MPGPGGGGRGGGGFGGGFGGGRGGGGFGGHRGGFHGGVHHRPRFGGWYHRPYYYGGGCLGGFIGMLIAPIIMVLLAIVLIFGYVGGAVTEVSQGGYVSYDEEVFQDYADQQYAREFGSRAYEDNLLLVFLTSEDNQGYCYIAWVGDHIQTDINYLFGSDGTALGTAMNNSINPSNYKYSLDSNLAQVITTMQQEVEALGLEQSFDCADERVTGNSHLTNYTDLSITEDTVNNALYSFTASTGIPAVIVVEDMEEVFGKTVSGDSIFWLVIAGILLLVAGWMFVKIFKNRKKAPDREERDNGYDRY